MRSSGGSAIRALLLLGCLLALPVLAIWGSSLPEAVHTALEGRVPGVPPAAAEPDREPPRFVPTPAAEGNRPAGQADRAAAPSAQNPQARIEQRLQQLGASYYRLEEWGDRRECFRFICEMPLGDSPQPARAFQAIRDDRLEAMAEVLRQVEAYRGG
jgi:hypothetical protein